MLPQPIWIIAFSVACPESETENERSTADLPSAADRIRQVLLEFQRAARESGGGIELLLSASNEFDQIAIQVAESSGLAIHVILPLPIQEFVDDFRGRMAAWDRSLAIIAKAGGLLDLDPVEISTICEMGERKRRTTDWPPKPLPGWTFRIAHGSHRRADCDHNCGAQMLAAADALIVWNQDNGNRTGDKLDVVEQAKARGLAIAIINSADKSHTSIDWGSKRWAEDPVMADIESVLPTGLATVDSRSRIESVFSALDAFASRTGGRLKNRVISVIVLQFTATILATINSALLLPKVEGHVLSPEFKWNSVAIFSQVLMGTVLILVSAAFVMGWVSRWTKLKSKWRQTRFGAEIMRGLIHTRGLVDPLYPNVSEHNPDWHRFALSSGLLAIRNRPAETMDWETRKAEYLRDRIVIQQKAYFEKLHVGASRLSAVCGRIGFWAGTFAPFCLLLALILKFTAEDWIAHSVWSPIFISFLPVLLPLLAGTATSLRVASDAGRRAERYQTMAQRLQAWSDWFPTLKAASSIRRAVVSAESILLDELIEWHAASKTTGK